MWISENEGGAVVIASREREREREGGRESESIGGSGVREGIGYCEK